MSDGVEEVWRERSDDKRQQKGAYKQREDFAQDKDKTVPKTESRVRCKKWHNSRDEHCNKKINKYGVGRETFHISAKLARDDCCCCCRGANKTKHCALDDGTTYYNRLFTNQVCGYDNGEGKYDETAALQKKVKEVPAAQVEFAGIDFAECNKQHGKNEPWLDEFDEVERRGFVCTECGEPNEEAIGESADSYGYCEHPCA